MRALSSRRTALKAGLSATGTAIIGLAGLRAAVAQTESEEECDALFVLSAMGLSSGDGTMTLHGPHPTVLYFCDRPVREAGHLTLEALSEQVQKGENNFTVDPPNAAVSVFNDDGSVDEIVVTLLTAPVIGSDTVTFEIATLDGTLPDEAGAVSVFIDPIGMPMSPTSAAGVHRRHRRRAIRRHN